MPQYRYIEGDTSYYKLGGKICPTVILFENTKNGMERYIRNIGASE